MAEWGDEYVGAGGLIRLRCGDYKDVLRDVEADAVIVDAPYSERTHGSYREMPSIGRNPIGYAAWSVDTIDEFVSRWSVCRGWFVSLTDHGSFPLWEAALESVGRYVFAPVACMEPGSRVRLAGDGPAQWSVWAAVARHKSRSAQQWGALPGGYVVPASEGWRGGARNGVTGSKPLWLMRAIVRDYSRPGDTVVDPCAGGATTLIASAMEGRRAIGAELDPATYELAVKRIARTAISTPLIREEPPRAEQQALWDLIDRDDPQSGW